MPMLMGLLGNKIKSGPVKALDAGNGEKREEKLDEMLDRDDKLECSKDVLKAIEVQSPVMLSSALEAFFQVCMKDDEGY